MPPIRVVKKKRAGHFSVGPGFDGLKIPDYNPFNQEKETPYPTRINYDQM